MPNTIFGCCAGNERPRSGASAGTSGAGGADRCKVTVLVSMRLMRLTDQGFPVRTIYKLCTAAEWTQAQRVGKFTGSAVDLRDGFIHFSTRKQVAGTAARHFAQRIDLVLVTVDADRLGPALKWEASRGGDLFPHVYATLDTAAAVGVRALPDGEARAEFLSNLPGLAETPDDMATPLSSPLYLRLPGDDISAGEPHIWRRVYASV